LDEDDKTAKINWLVDDEQLNFDFNGFEKLAREQATIFFKQK
jgi:hypothetical protein